MRDAYWRKFFEQIRLMHALQSSLSLRTRTSINCLSSRSSSIYYHEKNQKKHPHPIPLPLVVVFRWCVVCCRCVSVCLCLGVCLYLPGSWSWVLVLVSWVTWSASCIFWSSGSCSLLSVVFVALVVKRKPKTSTSRLFGWLGTTQVSLLFSRMVSLFCLCMSCPSACLCLA